MRPTKKEFPYTDISTNNKVLSPQTSLPEVYRSMLVNNNTSSRNYPSQNDDIPQVYILDPAKAKIAPNSMPKIFSPKPVPITNKSQLPIPSSTQIPVSPSTQVPSSTQVLHSAQIQVPPSAQIQVQPSAQIQVLPSAQIHVLPSAQIHVLPSAQIHVPSSGQIQATPPVLNCLPCGSLVHYNIIGSKSWQRIHGYLLPTDVQPIQVIGKSSIFAVSISYSGIGSLLPSSIYIYRNSLGPVFNPTDNNIIGIIRIKTEITKASSFSLFPSETTDIATWESKTVILSKYDLISVYADNLSGANLELYIKYE